MRIARNVVGCKLFMAGCLLVGLTVIFPRGAAAQIDPDSLAALRDCSGSPALYSAESSDAPAIVASAVAKSRLVFRTCLDGSKNTHYFVRELRRQHAGVCRAYEEEVFPAPTHRMWITMPYSPETVTLDGWSTEPPGEWKALGYATQFRDLGLQPKELGFATDDACPDPSDRRYIIVSNVSDGVLESFDHLWRRTTASPDAFAKAFPPEALKNQKFLQTALYRHAPFTRIACGAEDAEGDCEAVMEDFVVHFDVTDAGLAITGMSQIPQI